MFRPLPCAIEIEDVALQKPALDVLQQDTSELSTDPSIGNRQAKPHRPSRFETASNAKESSSDYHDPATQLVVERLNLIEDFYLNRVKENQKAKDPHLSIIRRMTDSGCIREIFDDPIVRRSLPEVLEERLEWEARLQAGNKRWRPGQQNTTYYTNPAQFLQPKAILRTKLRRHYRAGVRKAKKHATEFGYDWIYDMNNLTEVRHEKECDLSGKPIAPGTYSAKEIFHNLTRLWNTDPGRYMTSLSAQQDEREIAARREAASRLETAEARAPAPPRASHPHHHGDSKLLTTHFNGSRASFSSLRSGDSFASFASAGTFGANVKSVNRKINVFVQKATQKVPGLRCFQAKTGRSSVSGLVIDGGDDDETVASFNKTYSEAETSQEQLDSVSRWVYGLDTSLLESKSNAHNNHEEIATDQVLAELPAEVPDWNLIPAQPASAVAYESTHRLASPTALTDGADPEAVRLFNSIPDDPVWEAVAYIPQTHAGPEPEPCVDVAAQAFFSGIPTLPAWKPLTQIPEDPEESISTTDPALADSTETLGVSDRQPLVHQTAESQPQAKQQAPSEAARASVEWEPSPDELPFTIPFMLPTTTPTAKTTEQIRPSNDTIVDGGFVSSPLEISYSGPPYIAAEPRKAGQRSFFIDAGIVLARTTATIPNRKPVPNRHSLPVSVPLHSPSPSAHSTSSSDTSSVKHTRELRKLYGVAFAWLSQENFIDTDVNSPKVLRTKSDAASEKKRLTMHVSDSPVGKRERKRRWESFKGFSGFGKKV
jgi:hypothetical protein